MILDARVELINHSLTDIDTDESLAVRRYAPGNDT
jgi:hypothetical protein